MKLKRYLIEKDSVPLLGYDYLEIIELIKKDCKPYIKALTRPDNMLYRFLHAGGDRIKGTVRKNRKPVDTPLHIHKMIDAQFKKVHGFMPRSQGLFTWPTMRNPGDTGNNYLIFPIGNFKTVYHNDIGDLYVTLGELKARDWDIPQKVMDELGLLSLQLAGSGRSNLLVRDFERDYTSTNRDVLTLTKIIAKVQPLWWKYVEEVMTDRVKEYKVLKNKLPIWIGESREIMVMCDKYYGIAIYKDTIKKTYELLKK